MPTDPRPVRTPLVSVVLPVRDGLPWIRTAVQSVLAQTEDRWELLVVDDGSAAGTRRYLASLEDPRITVLSLPRSFGPSVARNRGVEAARAPRIAFLDADDAFEPRKIEVQVAALEREPQTGWSYSHFSRMDGEGRPLSSAGVRPWRPISGHIVAELASMDALVPTPTVMADRDLILAVGGFDESLRYCEDYDLWFRLAEKAPAVAVPEALSRIRSHPASYSRDRESVHRSWVLVYDRLADRSGDAGVGRIARREAARHALSAAYRAREEGRIGEAWRCWVDALRRRPWNPRCWHFLLGAPFRGGMAGSGGAT